MKSDYSTLMQSRFFNPAFNSAIFDGPLRIYFAQAQESHALKVYFGLQQNYAKDLELAKQIYQGGGHNLLVMLYPSVESYEISFDAEMGQNGRDELAGDDVIGFSGPIDDSDLNQVLATIAEVLRSWAVKVVKTSLQEVSA